MQRAFIDTGLTCALTIYQGEINYHGLTETFLYWEVALTGWEGFFSVELRKWEMKIFAFIICQPT